MRIGIFSDAYLPVINGVVTSIVTLKNGLEKQGHEVFIVSNHAKLYELEYKDRVLYLPGINIKFLFDNNLSTPVQIRAQEIIKQMNLDLIHVHTEFGIGLFARMVAKKENIPLIYTYHTTWEDYTHYINPIHSKGVEKMARRLVAYLSKQLSKPADAIITPSSKTKELLTTYGVYQPIHVIPTGVNLDRFKLTPELKQGAQDLRNKYHILDDEKLLIFVGRIGEEKNLEMLIESISMNKDKKIKLMLVGHGPIFDSLNELVEKQQLQSKVIFTNRVPNDQIATYYHAGDAFISASMTETQGLTFIEAMACGLPLFASDKDVLLDLLFEPDNGYYFNSLEELNAKIEAFLALDQSEYDQMVMNSLEYVKPYSDEVFVESILNLYEKVLSSSDEHNYSIIDIYKEDRTSLIKFSNELNYLTVILDNELVDELDLVEDRIISLKELSLVKEKDLINQKVSKCLAKLTYHDYSEAQMRTYLEGIDPEHSQINNEVIQVLLDKGFIDDERFIYELLQRYKDKGYGLYRIENNLKKYEFPQSLVNLVLETLSEDQSDDLLKQFNKINHHVFNGSKLSVKNKIYERLVRQGFKASEVSSLVSSNPIDYDETSSCELDYAKLKRKESDPYTLRNKLKQKGYQNETINKVMKEDNYED